MRRPRGQGQEDTSNLERLLVQHLEEEREHRTQQHALQQKLLDVLATMADAVANPPRHRRRLDD